jgi:hypothetical protein
MARVEVTTPGDLNKLRVKPRELSPVQQTGLPPPTQLWLLDLLSDFKGLCKLFFGEAQ